MPQVPQWATLAGSVPENPHKKPPLNREDDGNEMKVDVARLQNIFQHRNIKPINSERLSQDLDGFREALEAVGVRLPRPDVHEISRSGEVLVGVEIEIERTGSARCSPALSDSSVENVASHALYERAWKHTNDDSLRDEGAEFITQVGLRAKDLNTALQILELYFRSYMGKATANYRCGTHVHIDVRDLTVGQFMNMVMIYTIFENLLFHISGGRWKNPFCVPIRASGECLEPLMSVVLHKKNPTYLQFRAVFDTFKKYMAFNLLPTASLGTIEFRHHRGTSDPTELGKWVQVLLDIHRASQILTVEEIKELVFGLNDRNNYLEFAAKVFGTVPAVTGYSRQDLVQDMYDGSAFLKEVYLNSKGL